MAEPLVIQSLKDKRGEIHGRIAAYQAQIAQAKHDLAHINASIRLFTDPEHQRARYMVSHGFFKKGEIADICLRHLEIDGEIFYSLAEAKIVIESWRRHYNTVRPHGSLGYKPPAPEVFVPAIAARADAQPRPAPPPALAQSTFLN